MRIALGTDETSPLTDAVTGHLRAGGHEVTVLAEGQVEWPEVGRLVGEAVAGRRSDWGVVCCTTGTGVALAANKVRGVRAALCPDAATAAGARRWNDANVVALGLRLTSVPVALEIVDAFAETAFDPLERPAVDRIEP